MALSVIGFALGWMAAIMPSPAAMALRLYWFRLSDIVVPIGTVLVGLQYLDGQLASRQLIARARSSSRSSCYRHTTCGLKPAILSGCRRVGARVGPRTDRFITDKAAWLDVCRWARENTPPEAVFITPRQSSTFKWHSGRNESVTWKDMPQDAASIEKWWQRLRDCFGTGQQDPNNRWHQSLAELGDEKLRELAKKYAAQYAVVEVIPAVPRFKNAPVYENKSYAVYRIDDLTN